MIIGITGTLGAGKGTVVDYLVKKHGFKSYSMSGFIGEEVTRRGMPVNRDTLTDVGNELRKEFGPTHIGGALLERAKLAGGDAVVESLRSVGEVENLKKNGAVIWAVDANVHLRHERIATRQSEKDAVSFEKFAEDERREASNAEAWNMNLAACIGMADVVLRNDGSPPELYAQAENALRRLGGGRVHTRNYLTASLDDWQAVFHDLYGHIDDKRSFDSIWRHAMVNASKFSSDIRKNNFGLAFTHLAHILCWTLSFAERCRKSKELDGNDSLMTTQTLADFVWEKYPGACPYCETSPCSCASPGIVQKESGDLVIPVGNPGKRPKSLDDWGRMFDAIYGEAHAVIPIEALAFHLVEETGEVTSQIIRIIEMVNCTTTEQKKKELFREVADVFSWVCSVVSKINRTYFYPAARHFEKEQNFPDGSIPTATLSKILWDEYGSSDSLICSTCRTNPCSCDRKLKL